mgnify:CR=1 FL=1
MREGSIVTVLRKVGIIGIGHVGAHVANAVLSAGLAEELKLCDINEQKVVSECQDLSDTLGFYPHNCVIGNYGTQYEQLADCDVVINAAGDVKTSAKDRDGELFVTTDIARTWISRLFNAGFHGVIITISNPCDVVATEIWHITGYDPRKIIGTGTALDSARLRNAIAKRVNVDQKSIGAYMLGEHGNSQFAYWSNVNIAGKPLDQLAQDDPQRFALDKDETEQDARRGGYRVYAGKECTEYAIAATAARLTQAVLCMNTMRPPAPRCLPANKAKAAITPACRASSERTALKKSSVPHSPKANRPNSMRPASISAPISRSLHGGTTNASHAARLNLQ